MGRMYDAFDGSEPELIEAERQLFEADASVYGFDLTRHQCAAPEPWSEYADAATGHRWGGWLAARSMFQRRGQLDCAQTDEQTTLPLHGRLHRRVGRKLPTENKLRLIHITVQKEYKPGDLPPEGYLAWHEWAEVQRKAGIKQVQCGRCGLWRTPQELRKCMSPNA